MDWFCSDPTTLSVRTITHALPLQQKEIAMLVLSRKLDESIHIGGDIKITILRVKGNTIRLGIEAPRDVRVVRSELKPLDASTAKSDDSPATVTAVVDSPTIASPRLFVGSVNSNGSRVVVRPAIDATATGNQTAVSELGGPAVASDQSAPLSQFLRRSRGLTAV